MGGPKPWGLRHKRKTPPAKPTSLDAHAGEFVPSGFHFCSQTKQYVSPSTVIRVKYVSGTKTLYRTEGHQCTHTATMRCQNTVRGHKCMWRGCAECFRLHFDEMHRITDCTRFPHLARDVDATADKPTRDG
jgi:hypothetical protein